MQRGAHEKTPDDFFRELVGCGGLWWADAGVWRDMAGYAGICRDMPGA